MDIFVARLNVEHCRKVLATERDHERRELISQLLAQEEAKLAALERPSPRGAAAAPAATAPSSVSQFNLDYYRKRLATETDPTIRGILIRLIAEEEEEERIAPLEAHKISGDD